MIKKIYKYRNFSDPYMENIIKNASLYFASVDDFNDPYDCKLSFRQNYSKQEIKTYFISMKERNPNQPHRLKDMINKFGKNQDFVQIQNSITKKTIASLGVLSLSSNHSSILMWSHYAESHTGLVFEYTPKDLRDKKSCFYNILNVDYLEHYEELSYTNVNRDREEIPKLLLTKYKDWAYEEEYRCFGLDFQGEKNFYKDELTCIIFGAKASQTNIDKMIKLCKEYEYKDIKFKQAMLVHGSFSLSFKDLNI